MKTLITISFIYSIFGWYIKYKHHSKIDFDKMTLADFLLLLTTTFNVIFLLILILKYLP